MVMGFGNARLPLPAWSRPAGPAVLAVVAVLALAACASALSHPGSHPAATTHATPAPVRATPSCGPGPARHAWAVELTAGGRTIWQTPLPTRNVDDSPTVQPVLAGPV